MFFWLHEVVEVGVPLVVVHEVDLLLVVVLAGAGGTGSACCGATACAGCGARKFHWRSNTT